MRRIIVVGCPGSGKTSLALKLGRKLGLPVVHLEVLYWRPDWKASDKASFRARVADAIAGEDWVVDGSFSGLAFDLTCARGYLGRHRASALALPVAHRLAFSLRSRRDAARLTRRVPGAVRLEIDAGGLALQLRPPAGYRGRAPEVCRDLPVVRLNRDREIEDFLDTAR